jgi:bZIP factor
MPEMALDLTKSRRGDSVESDTRKSSSYEELPNTRESPNNSAHLLQIHHRNLSKLNTLTPEHAMQYHYNFEHSSPSTTSAAKHSSPSRSPLAVYEKFEALPIMRKHENYSPAPVDKPSSPSFKNLPIRSSPHFEHYAKMENSHFRATPQLQSPPPIIEHEDSNEAPSANISSSSSVASSQKSPSSSITSHATQSSMMVMTREGKLSRPFKAYPRDPLSLAAAGSILDGSSAEKYAVFRKRMLDQIHAANGGSVVVNNPKMRRISNKNEETNNNEPEFQSSDKTPSVNGSSDKDDAYFERRRKNNAAAKKSRDRRRIKEDEIAIRAAFLERENIELKFELAAARKQLAMYSNGIVTN